MYDGAPAAPSLLDIAEPDDRVIVCNSFSKTWVMTGWRLGWLVVPEGARDAITELVEVTHSGVAPFIQHAGLAAVQRHRRHVAVPRPLRHRPRTDRRGAVGPQSRALCRAGWRVLRFRRRGGTDRQPRPRKRLVHEHKVAVAPGIAFGDAGEGYLRICFAQSADRIERAMERLRDGIRSAAA